MFLWIYRYTHKCKVVNFRSTNLDVKTFLTNSMLAAMPPIRNQLPSKAGMTKAKYTNKTPHTS